MKKLVLIALLVAFANVTNVPTLVQTLGFGPTVAYALDDDPGIQGDSDIQGDQP